METQKRLAGRSYTSHESKQSSKYWELVAIHDTWTIEVNLEKFRRKKVCHFSDNKELVFIIAKGGMAYELSQSGFLEMIESLSLRI